MKEGLTQPAILWIQLKRFASIVFIRLQVGLLDFGCFSFFSPALCKCEESQGSIV